jgi:excisionase family DNA binding protein
VRALDHLLTVKEVSKILKTNPTTVYKLIKANKLPALKLGSLKVRQVSLDAFLTQYDGMDLTDLRHISEINPTNETEV